MPETVAESVFRNQKTDECVCQLTTRSKIEIYLGHAPAFYPPNPFDLVSDKAVGSSFVFVYRRLLSVCSCGGEELLHGSFPLCSSEL